VATLDERDQLQAALGAHYAIERELGRGGMATVYLARDLRHERLVALKVLRADLGAALGAERFTREIKLAAGLQHPHIVPVHDSGVTAAGQLWFTMPYVEGESLRARLEREKQLPVDDALQITREVADALAYAHQQGIIHRDIKPENLLLSRGHAMVADFGVARAMGSDGDASGQKLTETGMALGTPAYMSPEQATGERALDARTDVYALGCVLYEMLSGEPPYTGATAQVILAKRVTGDVPSVRRLRPAVPVTVDLTLTKALAPVPADRFASASAFAQALQASGGSETNTQAVRRTGRRAIAVASAASIALVIAAGIIVGRYRSAASPESAAPAGSPVRLAVLPFDNLGDSADAYFADGMTDAVRGKLTAIPGLEVIAPASSAQYRKTTKTPQQIGQELGVRYLLVGKVRWAKVPGSPERVEVSPALVEVSSAADKWEQPFDALLTDVFQVQADIAGKVAQQLQVTLNPSGRRTLEQRPTTNLDAYDAYLRGREAENGTSGSERRAAEWYEMAVRRDSTFALAWAALAAAHTAMYGSGVPTPADADAARMAAERAVALAPDLPEAHDALGGYYAVVRDDYARAEAEVQSGLRLSPNNALLVRDAAYAEISFGHWDRAIVLTERATQLDPLNTGTAMDLGWQYLYLRRYADARRVLDRVLVAAPGRWDAMQFRAKVDLAQGDLAGARAIIRTVSSVADTAALVVFLAESHIAWVLDSAQERVLRGLGPSAFDNDRGIWGLVIAQEYALRGEQLRARAYADSARQAYEAHLRVTPNDANLHAQHGVALAYLGRRDEAVAEGKRGVALHPISVDAFSGPAYLHQLARIYILVGEPEKALDQLEALLKLPYYLSPGWLRIDPNVASLRGNPRFERLIAQPVTGERPTA
jgi:eukaryotic-like serine/threonine-protein kinase